MDRHVSRSLMRTVRPKWLAGAFAVLAFAGCGISQGPTLTSTIIGTSVPASIQPAAAELSPSPEPEPTPTASPTVKPSPTTGCGALPVAPREPLACTGPPPSPDWPITVFSDSFPTITIECHGSPELSARQCRRWAERLLDRPPAKATSGGRLRLTNRPEGRCSANFYDRNGRATWTAALVCPEQLA